VVLSLSRFGPIPFALAPVLNRPLPAVSIQRVRCPLITAWTVYLPLAYLHGRAAAAYKAAVAAAVLRLRQVTYQEALAATFVESFIFMFISLVGIRGRLIELVPKHIMLATAVGIGLFLAHIGFHQAEGIGLITFDPATLVTMGEWESNESVGRVATATDFGKLLYWFW
jgi:xanthine/uracil/vitamin C permease (AzgA family)